MPAGFWSAVKSDGGDIRAYDASNTMIPHDLCTFATGSTSGILMVKKSLLTASSNVIKVMCGNAALSQLAVGNANGRNAVWSNFDWVAGFDGTTTDRTGASRTVAGNTPVYGSVRPAFFKFAQDQKITWETLTHRSAYTWGCSYYDTVTLADHECQMNYCDKTNVGGDRQSMAIKYPQVTIAMWNNSDSWVAGGGPGPGNTLNTLYRAEGTCNGTSGRVIYLDGSAVANSGGTSTVRPISGTQMGVGGGSGVATEGFNGEIGYCFLANGIHTAAHIAGRASNWHNPSAFYAIT
jgi:hypothetical protein